MIWIGLTGWGDHPSLYESDTKASKLERYCSHFPIVECDSSFYAMQPEKNYVNWANETPDGFRFIAKAYQGMTGHQRGKTSFRTIGEMFDTFRLSIEPLLQSGKCPMILFQYPPWFDCSAENIEKLRYTKERMGEVPVAIEFRNSSWYLPEIKVRTLSFLEKEGWIHTICDEPQTETGSVPMVLSGWGDAVLVRLHGRNLAGWLDHGPNWRKVRCLYRYNGKELDEWKRHLMILNRKVKNVYVLFNNNSGGDAAGNAKQLISLLGLHYPGLAPKQLGFFDHNSL